MEEGTKRVIENIKSVMQYRKMSQFQLGTEIGNDGGSSVSKILSGQHHLKMDTICQ